MLALLFFLFFFLFILLYLIDRIMFFFGFSIHANLIHKTMGMQKKEKIRKAVYKWEDGYKKKRRNISKEISTKILPESINKVDKSLLKFFEDNLFDPAIHSITIPDSPGNYIIALKPNSKLAIKGFNPVYKQIKKYNVIYVGKASKSLYKRDYKQHFKGNNSGSSTLRKSIGVLMGLKKIKRDLGVNNKTKFEIRDEERITNWMHKNLVMFYFVNEQYDAVEQKLLDYFSPPLNLKGINSEINKEIRQYLFTIRNK
ncbi:MAG TPA: hypothetical protein DIU05_08925 [Bacteroidetes bacterium]|nr:hypothetical protein [Bacteroidota bacterium]